MSELKDGELQGALHTFSDFKNRKLVKAHHLGMRAQSSFSISEKVFLDGGIPKLMHECIISINTTSRLVQFYKTNDISAISLAGGKAPHHVAV